MSEQRINDGGAAYPHDQNSGQWCQGMTLRQWYAGQALAAIVSCLRGTEKDEDWRYSEHLFDNLEDGRDTVRSAAEYSFAYADAMIEHEQKERDNE